MNASEARAGARHSRRDCGGFTLFETLVAMSILTTMLSIMVPAMMRARRLHSYLWHERAALHELSNHLERLSLLDGDELKAAVKSIQSSPEIRATLKHPDLSAELKADQYGQQLVVSLAWDDPGRRQKPLSLSLWLFPESPADVVEAGE